MDQEAKLDEGLRHLMGKSHEPYAPHEWAGMRELHRVSLLHPGEYVVYRDYWEGEGDTLTLRRCEVLFHSLDLRAAQNYISNLPNGEQQDVTLTFAEAAEGAARNE